jgi:hypothetical protein
MRREEIGRREKAEKRTLFSFIPPINMLKNKEKPQISKR